jgi:hypothetical protein
LKKVKAAEEVQPDNAWEGKIRKTISR